MLSKHQVIMGQKARLGGRDDYPGDERFQNSLLVLKETLEYYEKNLKNKLYKIYLANGDTFEFKFDDSFISHLLGFDAKTFMNTEPIANVLGKERLTTYDLMKRLVDLPDILISINKSYDFQLYNPFRIVLRCAALKDFANFTNLNFGFLYYDKTKTPKEKQGEVKSTKFLFINSGCVETDNMMLGFALNSKNNEYYEETLFVNTDKEKMFTNQKTTFPTKLEIMEHNITEAADKFGFKTTIENAKKTTYQPSLATTIQNLNNAKAILVTYNCQVEDSEFFSQILNEKLASEQRQLTK